MVLAVMRRAGLELPFEDPDVERPDEQRDPLHGRDSKLH